MTKDRDQEFFTLSRAASAISRKLYERQQDKRYHASKQYQTDLDLLDKLNHKVRGFHEKEAAMYKVQKPPAKKITAWSFSRWSAHSGENGCPFKAKLKFVDKLQEPSAPAMARGAEIHKLAQTILEKPKTKVPKELVAVKAALDRLRKLKAQAELELCLTRDWLKTGWFDKSAWLRIKIDAIAARDKHHRVVDVVDWKTGKYNPDNKEYALQLELYGAGVLSAYEHVEEVHAALIFTDHAQRVAPPAMASFSRKDLPKLIKTWETRIKPVLSDTRFSPRPGWYCRFCHFRKENGGPCKF